MALDGPEVLQAASNNDLHYRIPLRAVKGTKLELIESFPPNHYVRFWRASLARSQPWLRMLVEGGPRRNHHQYSQDRTCDAGPQSQIDILFFIAQQECCGLTALAIEIP